MEQHTRVGIGTRASKLALTQTDMVMRLIAAARPDLVVEAVHISTRGDRIQDRPLAEVGGKALFVAEIETALREGTIQLAVHSGKDMPSDLPDDMRIAACLPRADARDVLISRVSSSLDALPQGARVGTSSPRRACQLRALRPDLMLLDIRGNVDTRVAKLEAGQYDAIVLAAAGLSRLNMLDLVTQYLAISDLVPCAAQGAIAIEVCATNSAAHALAMQLDHPATSIAVTAERAFLSAIGGSCDTPLAAHATLDDDTIFLRAMVGDADGRIIRGDISGPAWDAAATGVRLAEQLMTAGGAELLRGYATTGAWSNAKSHG